MGGLTYPIFQNYILYFHKERERERCKKCGKKNKDFVLKPTMRAMGHVEKLFPPFLFLPLATQLKFLTFLFLPSNTSYFILPWLNNICINLTSLISKNNKFKTILKKNQMQYIINQWCKRTYVAYIYELIIKEWWILSQNKALFTNSSNRKDFYEHPHLKPWFWDYIRILEFIIESERFKLPTFWLEVYGLTNWTMFKLAIYAN